jgi:hypothetical protein
MQKKTFSLLKQLFWFIGKIFIDKKVFMRICFRFGHAFCQDFLGARAAALQFTLF